ncbi:MAG TPA: ribonuclease HIII [Kiritimatiellia bacterium]|nr:ribonuclease HIII [Kiritimatiellia bacterium]HRU71448.1 ribonuclease HIII [Kiritimatiellia bacterium]
MEKKNSYTFVLNSEQQEALKILLRMGNYRPKQVPHTIIAVEAQDCVVNLYKSGKCLVQGKGAEDFVLFFLEPNVLQAATVGYEEVLNPDLVAPHMGIDESGKGDFFGPLVACAVYVDPDLAHAMQEIGVKDCKQLTDKAVFFIGHKTRQLLGPKRFAMVSIGPEAYNRLYAKIRNVNSLLAWAHARCIENLLETVPDCPRAVADQFGAKQVIERALMKKGRSIKLEQRHKAESDIAVAAASVLAREAFLRGLGRLGETYGIQAHKGASEQVKASAIELVKKAGPEVLLKTCKCHFKTTDQVLAACGSSRAALGPEGQAVSRGQEKAP